MLDKEGLSVFFFSLGDTDDKSLQCTQFNLCYSFSKLRFFSAGSKEAVLEEMKQAYLL